MEKGGGGGGGAREGDYTLHFSVTARLTPALRWAAMTAIFMFSLIVRGKVTKSS